METAPLMHHTTPTTAPTTVQEGFTPIRCAPSARDALQTQTLRQRLHTLRPRARRGPPLIAQADILTTWTAMVVNVHQKTTVSRAVNAPAVSLADFPSWEKKFALLFVGQGHRPRRGPQLRTPRPQRQARLRTQRLPGTHPVVRCPLRLNHQTQ